MGAYQLKNEELTLTVISAGAEMKSLKDNKTEQEYLWQADPKFWGRTSPVLFPIVGNYVQKQSVYEGKTYTLSQHGFARDMEFDLESQTEEEIWFVLKDTESTLEKYPFHFILKVGYRLSGRQVEVMWKVENPNDKKMYFSIGGHPAFNCPLKEGEKQEDCQLVFDPEGPRTSSILNEEGALCPRTKILNLFGKCLKLEEHLFDEDALIELSESIKQFGILQPLLCQERDDYYEIVAGERRWRAAKMAGLKEVPVIIKKLTNQQIMEISLIENIQREDLNPIEEAFAYKRLLEEFKLKQDDVAERVSKSRTAVTNSMRLLKLNEKVQQMVIDEMLTTGHARALLGIEDQNQQYVVAQQIFDQKLSVRDTEKLVKSLQKNKKKTKSEKTVNPQMEAIYRDLEEKLKKNMGTKVLINRKNENSGKIEIEYYSEEDLERLLVLLKR